ncbi:60S ribosomal protein L27 [Plecturocebus cupreus]
MLARCYSRHKAILMKNTNDGILDHPDNQGLVGGSDCYPCKVIAARARRSPKSKIDSSVKVYNHNRFMPTRYSVDTHLDKTVINKDVFRNHALQFKAQQETKVQSGERHKIDKSFLHKLQL